MLITGATSGVGKALAEYYYKKNYKLILVGSSTEKVEKQSIKYKKNTITSNYLDFDFPNYLG